MPDQPEQVRPEVVVASTGRATADPSLANDLELADRLIEETVERIRTLPGKESREYVVQLSRLTYWRRTLRRYVAGTELEPEPPEYAGPASEPVGRGAAQAARLRSLAGEPEPD